MKTHRILAAALSGLLVVSLAAPATALALPNQAKGNGPAKSKDAKAAAKQTRQAQNLQRRIDRVVAMRQRKFAAAKVRLERRIARLTTLSSKVASQGADVTSATVALTLATEKIAQAETEELKAQDLLKAVPAAADRKAAFAAARAQAKVAQKSLQAARLQVVRAMQVLRKAIAGLEAEAETTTEAQG